MVARTSWREGQGEWLRGLPFCHDFVMSGRRIRLFHASAATVHRRVRFDHDEAEFLGMFANTAGHRRRPDPDVVGYADTHDPFYEVDLGGGPVQHRQRRQQHGATRRRST